MIETKAELRIGEVTLGGAPRVVMAVRDDAPPEEVDAAIQAGVDILELRIDAFSRKDPDHVLGVVESLKAYPLLATIRSKNEGGGWEGPEEDRAALFEAVLPHVQAVDVELSSREIVERVMRGAKKADCLCIGSYHNFAETPVMPRLRAAVNDGKDLGADVVKIAAHCGSIADVRTLAQATVECRDRHVAIIGMGPMGMLSRIFFPALGSLLTYTFLGEATAPGQLTYEQTLAYLSSFYPEVPSPRGEEASKVTEEA